MRIKLFDEAAREMLEATACSASVLSVISVVHAAFFRLNRPAARPMLTRSRIWLAARPGKGVIAALIMPSQCKPALGSMGERIMTEQPQTGIMQRWSRSRRLQVALTMALVIIGFCVYYDTGPKHHGKGPGYWLRQLEYGSQTSKEEVIVAFRSMGLPAVPYLARELERKPISGIWKRSLHWLGSVSTQEESMYNQRSQDRRANAAFLLGEMGKLAKATLPLLR
jgi:hypothetical protein